MKRRKRRRTGKPLRSFLAAVHRPGCINIITATGETWHAARAVLALKAKVEPADIRPAIRFVMAGGES